MNTTALTFDQTEDSYTILSSRENEASFFSGISLVLLSRGGKPFRKEQLEKLVQFQIREIISVEKTGQGVDLSSQDHPQIKTLYLSETINIGQQINIAMKEASGSHVLVMWDDMDLQIMGKAGRLFSMAAEQDSLCSVPVLMNSRKESIPIRLAPVQTGKKLEVFPLGSIRNEAKTLYPFDYCGIYNRKKFLLSEGYDSKISSPYWQKLDFGFRAFLWGEDIQCYTGIKIAYQNGIPNDDTSSDMSYRRFYLKNLALHFKGDSCALSIGSILRFHIQSGMSVFSSFQDYKNALSWVKRNKYRFKLDAFSLTELWELE